MAKKRVHALQKRGRYVAARGVHAATLAISSGNHLLIDKRTAIVTGTLDRLPGTSPLFVPTTIFSGRFDLICGDDGAGRRSLTP
jgi:hypothetical protein